MNERQCAESYIDHVDPERLQGEEATRRAFVPARTLKEVENSGRYLLIPVRAVGRTFLCQDTCVKDHREPLPQH